MRVSKNLRVRRSMARWYRLSILLNSIERCFAQNCKLDAQAIRGEDVGSAMSWSRAEQMIDKLEAQIDHEMDLLVRDKLVDDVTRAKNRNRPILPGGPVKPEHHSSRMAVVRFMADTD